MARQCLHLDLCRAAFEIMFFNHILQSPCLARLQVIKNEGWHTHTHTLLLSLWKSKQVCPWAPYRAFWNRGPASAWLQGGSPTHRHTEHLPSAGPSSGLRTYPKAETQGGSRGKRNHVISSDQTLCGHHHMECKINGHTSYDVTEQPQNLQESRHSSQEDSQA